MIRVPARARSLARVAATMSVAGAILASCATATVAAPHVTGLPAISISVPLSTVGCTTNNSCVALGTSDLGVTPASFGEYRLSSGRWARLSVPTADSSTYIEASSCWVDGCLFVGSQSSGDLLWRYDESTHAVTSVSAPPSAMGIEAVSCFSSMTCAILDVSRSGPRFLTTDDGGTTWSAPVTLGVAPHDSVAALSCTIQLHCMAILSNGSDGVEVYVTSDGGATWAPRTGFATVSWATLTSLTCVGRKCLGVANLSTGWRIVRTDNFGRSWSKVDSLSSTDPTLACTTLERCVIGGVKHFTAPWLATVISGAVTSVKLKFVPTPIGDVACGSKVCAAIGVTTVMALRP